MKSLDARECGGRTPEDKWGVLAECLGVEQRETVAQLTCAIARATRACATPFEAIVGSPHVEFGVRVTFRAAGSSAASIEDALGLAPHPWGPAAWWGLRITRNGAIDWKRYYYAAAAPVVTAPPPNLPSPLVPVMASLHGGVCEVYYRLAAELPWHDFASRCAALVEGPPPATRIVPRPVADSFCLSLRRDHDRVTAVTLFADDRSLQDDERIAEQWSAELPDKDRLVYATALTGVRALGRRPVRGWHAMLAWTLDRQGHQMRAVSLRVRE